MAADTTSVPISRAVAEAVRTDPVARKLKIYAWIDAAAMEFLKLSPEQRAIAVAAATTNPPSAGDRRHGVKPATAKQPLTRRRPAECRKAG